jgi:tight adherence protein C
MLNQQVIILACSFVGVASMVLALLALLDPYGLRMRARVDEVQQAHRKGVSSRALGDTDAKRFLPRISELLLRAIHHHGDNQPYVERRLSKAGIYDGSAASVYYAARLLLIATPPAAALCMAWAYSWNMDWALPIGSALSAVGAFLPGLWLDRKIAERHKMLRRSLPDFIDLMIVCLEGGLSIQESIRRVGDELEFAHPALAIELRIVQHDIELGASVAQGLKRFALRTQYEGVRTLSTFVREAQRFGTNLSDALRLHSDMLRSQREQAAEETAQKAAVKILLPTLLLIFPAIFVVLVGPALIQIHESFSVR